MAKKPVFTEDDLGVNPFSESLVIQVRRVALHKQFKREGDLWVQAEMDLEYDQHAKVYCSAQRRQVLNKLPLRSKEMLLWIIQESEHGKDYLWINRGRYMAEMEIVSPITLKTAIKELIRHGIISPTVVTDVYWINPQYVFKGNRVTKFPSKVEVI